MNRFLLSLLVVPFLLLGTAAGQSPKENKSNTAKAFTLSGKVSNDGKSVVSRDGQSWLVTNPVTLLGHEGQLVKIKCRVSTGSHDVRVLSVKTVPTQMKYAANPGDSAFRR